jgi:hypothetical protein
MTDFRALCEELTNELHGYASANPHHDSDELVSRARAALAEQPVGPSIEPVPGDAEGLAEVFWNRYDQPEPVGPTESDVTELFYHHMGEGSEVGFENAIAEALARWGQL